MFNLLISNSCQILCLAFYIQLGEEVERKIYLPYHDQLVWNVLEAEMPGNLTSAETVKFRYDDRDIMCIEMLELETLEGNLHFDIIQVDYS